jgi:hypothetical protein
MSRIQKRESRALKAKNERLRAEIAMRDSVLNTLPGTNAINVTEEGISPTASLVRGVNPDTDLSETDPPTNTSVTERASSPTASLSKGVESDTVLAETVSPADTNVTERAISSTASLWQQVDPDTAQTKTGPQNQVNSSELTTEGVAPKETTPTKSTVSTEGLTPPRTNLLHESEQGLISRTLNHSRMLRLQRLSILQQS